MNFSDKRVLVMGLGIQGGGEGVARFFAEKGAKVTVTDLKTEKELSSSIASLSDLPITYVLGKHREEDFKNTDLIIRNPDVPRESPYLAVARKYGIPVEMDESLFLKLWSKRENIIGVTGTRGKTTTTHLIGAILKKAGYNTLLGGNLQGIATLSLLDKITPTTKVVLELSSWQLQGLDWNKISPHVAVITNIYPDHLNRYKNMGEYINDKKIIFKYQKKDDFLVLNRENKVTQKFARLAKSRVVWFSTSDTLHRGVLGFQLKGEHNLENLAAAYAAAKILKIDDKIIRAGVEGFEKVPFRLQEVGVINGVTYVNDTTSTMPQATIAALKAYAGRPIILICGGASKKLPIVQLAREISKRVKSLVLLEGTATDELQSAIRQLADQPTMKILGRFADFKKAILTAKKAANHGDVVLLSPGCASFGLFKNEFDRGEKFNDVVSWFQTKTG